MSKIYLIGDTHFNHKNIIEYTSRIKYFEAKDIQSMEKEIIKRWNDVVKKDDIVYHVGDFAFGPKEVIKDLVSKLNGRIRLILGNHDRRSSPHWYDGLGFDAIYPFPIILDDWFIVSHEPIKYLGPSMPYINIHGHTHDEEYSNEQRVNVCWEIVDGYPIEFNKIKEKFNDIEKLDVAKNVFVKDRHRENAMNYNEGYLAGFSDALRDDKIVKKGFPFEE